MYILLKVSSDVLAGALVNTIVGMGSVFVALIVISFLISRLKDIVSIVNFFENRKNNKARKKAAKSKRKQREENVEKPNETVVFKSNSHENINDDYLSEVDDYELVAVITAAIMAYMGDDAPDDGLIVRSIRRVRRNA